jgi:hypothetical protein
MGQIIPKLRMEAPTAFPLRSSTVTLYPLLPKANAVARPTMPAPITIADLDIVQFYFFWLLQAVFAIEINGSHHCDGNAQRGKGQY